MLVCANLHEFADLTKTIAGVGGLQSHQNILDGREERMKKTRKEKRKEKIPPAPPRESRGLSTTLVAAAVREAQPTARSRRRRRPAVPRTGRAGTVQYWYSTVRGTVQ